MRSSIRYRSGAGNPMDDFLLEMALKRINQEFDRGHIADALSVADSTLWIHSDNPRAAEKLTELLGSRARTYLQHSDRSDAIRLIKFMIDHIGKGEVPEVIAELHDQAVEAE